MPEPKSEQLALVANIVLFSAAGLLIAGAVTLATTSQQLIGIVLLVAGVGDIVAWMLLRAQANR